MLDVVKSQWRLAQEQLDVCNPPHTQRLRPQGSTRLDPSTPTAVLGRTKYEDTKTDKKTKEQSTCSRTYLNRCIFSEPFTVLMVLSFTPSDPLFPGSKANDTDMRG